MTPILEFDHLSVRYGRLQAVDGVSLALAEGETLGLIGESGCGKSTLARAAVGLVPAKGAIQIEGKDAAAERRRDRRFVADRAQMLFQDPAASLSPRLTVRSLVAEPFRIRGRYGPEVEGWIAERFGELGLSTDLLDRYAHQLSGGQARRVAIARVLAAEPRIIIADEPTAGLDVSVQGDILNLLAEMKRRRRLSYLVISHNLNVVGRVTDRVAVMYLGRIVEIGETARLFRQPAHPYTAALLSSNLSVHPRRGAERIVLKGDLPSPSDPPSGCRFHPRCPSARPLCARVDPALTDVSDGGQAACHFPLVQAPAASPTMLQAMTA